MMATISEVGKFLPNDDISEADKTVELLLDCAIDKTGSVPVGQGAARLGWVQFGMAGCGMVGLGAVRHGRKDVRLGRAGFAKGGISLPS
jgi:hypothetical protein